MTVQDQEENSGAGGGVAVVGAAVGIEVFRLQAVAHQLALQEHQLAGGSFFHDLGIDRGGLIHGVGLTVFRIDIGVLAVSPAVPVFVPFETHVLVSLVVGHDVRAVGDGGLKAGAVGVGPDAFLFGQALVVQVDLDDPVAGQVVQKVEARKGLAEHEGDLIVAGLVAADGLVIVKAGGIFAGDGVQFIRGHRLIFGASAKIRIVQFLAAERVVNVLAVNGLVQNGDVLRQAVAVSIGIAGIGIPEIVSVNIQVFDLAALFQELSGRDADRGVFLLALQGEVLGTSDAQVARIVVGGAVVEELRIKQTLHGFHVGVRVDRGAVGPFRILVQGDLVGIAFGRIGRDVEFGTGSLDLGGHIDGHLSSHFRNDDIAFEGFLAFQRMRFIVEEEGIKTHVQEVGRIGLVRGLIGVRVPVRGQRGYRILVHVIRGLFRLGSYRARRFGCGRSRLNGSLGCGLFLGGRSRALFRLSAAGGQRKSHGQCAHKCQQFLHTVSSLVCFGAGAGKMPAPVTPLIRIFYSIFFLKKMQV